MSGKSGGKNTITGVISTTAKGAGYIDYPDPKKESVYIEAGDLNTALNGDTVEAEVSRKKIRGVTQDVGRVLRVISRAKTLFVGVVMNENGRWYVIPDDRKAYVNMAIYDKDVQTFKLENGHKVQVKLVRWDDPETKPAAEVVKVLGKKGDNDVEMESIVLEKGFEVGFPAAVEKDAETIEENKSITAEEIAKRRDMRGTLTFTIDPYDAKDFDDAISFKDMGDGTYEIGVHIADVSHYVTPGSALDREAVKRGCSVYLVDRTIPMLPEALSNDVCSLNPHTDKLAFSAVFILDDKAKVVKRWFGKTVINSDHRFTYEAAQAVIDGKPENIRKYSNDIQGVELAEAGIEYKEQLTRLNSLAKILQKEKFSKGAIEFEQDEVQFRLDEKGKPIKAFVKQRLDAHKLVEEYMLLANREVARFIYDQMKKKGGKDTGAIYRIHEKPDKEKIKELSSFVKALGYELRAKDGVVTAHDLNSLFDQIEDTPHESLIRIAALRSMQKAVYSTKNVGHFGLAFDFYTHFTSPIRRYPDLLVHRTLAKHLHNEPFGDREAAALQKMAESSTDREIDAAEAERASRKLKQVEYMSERLGQTFTGSISGVTKWGIYVEEDETKCEGMIPIRELGQDYFNFDERTYSIVGERTGKKFTLGDKVRFKVLSADLDRKTLDYRLV
ncbi:MAG: ribonuclease R [Patescibacteria group bacterium]|nr:ribonuclease R [Patescibacteria group bacterium]